MSRLSLPIEDMKEEYTVVVVGSGYGGGISASRMARAGKSVCLLERGKEFIPGEFPDTLLEASTEMQVDGPKGHIGSKTALFDFHVNDDMSVLVGCGLGGTSLINANVVIKPIPKVFDDPAWPKALREDLEDGLKKGYQAAADMLKPNPYPKNWPELKKLTAQEISAKAMNQPMRRTNISVTFDEHKNGINHVGVAQSPCSLCGDCVSGCNYTSKNTVQMNYLPDAVNHGAEIFTEAKVRYVERQGGKWLVHFERMGVGRQKFDAPTQFVKADIVILSAGTLGSTEIMLRSREHGLKTSPMLGKHFTGNGDALAFGYNCDHEINGVGFGKKEPDKDHPAGPCITGIIDTRETEENYKNGMSIEEGVIPGALAPVLTASFAALGKTIGEDMDQGILDFITEKKRELEGMVRGPYHGAVNNTQTYLVMTHDSASGVMYLDKDRLRIKWPGVGEEPIFERVQERMKEAVKALGGTYLYNPMWNQLLGYPLVTVHPLGGCVMGDNASNGAVNHKGQVFNSDNGDSVYEGLYVADGSVLPTSVGTNPFYTISAVSERNAALLAKDRGWSFKYDLPSKNAKPCPPAKIGVRFTETMTGWFSNKVQDDYKRGKKVGKEDNSEFTFTLTVVSDDLETMLADDKHQARMTGTVIAPALSSEPLNVTDGVFNLFVKDPKDPKVKRMIYNMEMHAQDGKEYYFNGYKMVRDDFGLDVWSDTSTLYITVYEGSDSKGKVIGKGILNIKPADFAKQATTMKILNAKGPVERAKYMAKFGAFFGGSLIDTYANFFNDVVHSKS